MKRVLILLLTLALVSGLAACGEVKQGEVVENVDSDYDYIVIETPPAMVNGPETPASTYAPVSVLPTTAPSPTPSPTPISTPEPTPAQASPAPTNPPASTPEPFEYADDTGMDYNATATQEEKDNAVPGYITGDGVNFRVGPGKGYKVYESLPKGTQIKILAKAESGWIKIWYKDYLIGYVSADYVAYGTPGEDAAILTPSPEPTDDSGSEAVIVTP